MPLIAEIKQPEGQSAGLSCSTLNPRRIYRGLENLRLRLSGEPLIRKKTVADTLF